MNLQSYGKPALFLVKLFLEGLISDWVICFHSNLQVYAAFTSLGKPVMFKSGTVIPARPCASELSARFLLFDAIVFMC